MKSTKPTPKSRMTVCTTNLQPKRDKNKTKYQAKINRHESGKGKKN